MADASNVDSESHSDYDINDAETSSLSKRQKLMSAKKNSGAARYKSKFNPEWKRKYSFIVEVKNDKHRFHCTVCKHDISCGHMGFSDVERHIGKAMHQKNAKAVRTQTTLSFPSSSSPLAEKVTIGTCKFQLYCGWLLVEC